MFGPLPLPVPWAHVQLARAFSGEELYALSRNWYAATTAGVLGVLSRLSGDIVVGNGPKKGWAMEVDEVHLSSKLRSQSRLNEPD